MIQLIIWMIDQRIKKIQKVSDIFESFFILLRKKYLQFLDILKNNWVKSKLKLSIEKEKT